MLFCSEFKFFFNLRRSVCSCKIKRPVYTLYLVWLLKTDKKETLELRSRHQQNRAGMTLHFWNAPDGVGSHKEVGIHPAGHQVVSVYNTCEKFLCSGFFLWSARWNWPFLSPQDFGVAWEATFTQVPAREFKKYIINSQVKQKSTLICYMSCIRNMAMKPLCEGKLPDTSFKNMHQTYRSLHQPLLPIQHRK